MYKKFVWRRDLARGMSSGYNQDDLKRLNKQK